ncbi:polyphosphate:nucleotide phosphotransferase, PPK2 family [Raineyella antarctica]|uniref:Polyphosphate:nucleotide phosphotransferase, PPK2 family n=1 Tax=Raineyella antarctica TaxID=1577474 RepID=A0A1G6GPR1_9ACTN|nr:PPK2 family polyphosphate kinase [Raineyella antarctica]SDB83921.1 polyphosphate:nucleotide phosphotransferase, PPK2 family [Raineyella antarctica]
MATQPDVPSLDVPLSALLRVPPGPVDLGSYDCAATTGYPGEKDGVDERMTELGETLSQLQERLFANGRTYPDTAPAALLVLQGMDTSGKGGVLRHTVGMVDVQGLSVAAFKKPTPEELEHDFLWRIAKEVPEPGFLGTFDRSHYEDVLVSRVEQLAPPEEIEQRYDEINAFEAGLVARGIVVIKCFLHMSYAEQGQRLMERLERPDKHWKYNPGDVEARQKWPAYQDAYTVALERCNTVAAPWFVIPSDKKWYRNWAVAQLLAEHLQGLNLDWPAGDFDVQAEKERLSRTFETPARK